MIDQHAAHERIRLEALLDGTVTNCNLACSYLYSPFPSTGLYDTDTSISGGALPPQIRSSTVRPPLAIKLQPSEVNLARLFHQQLKHNGMCRQVSTHVLLCSGNYCLTSLSMFVQDCH